MKIVSEALYFTKSFKNQWLIFCSCIDKLFSLSWEIEQICPTRLKPTLIIIIIIIIIIISSSSSGGGGGGVDKDSYLEICLRKVFRSDFNYDT